MNLALSALALLILLIPGYVAAQTYLGQIGRFGTTDAAASEALPRAWLRALFISPFIHAAAIWISRWRGWPAPDFDFLLSVLAGEDLSDNSAPYKPLTDHLVDVFKYFTSLTIVSALSGLALHKVVRKFKWDRRFQFLRFPNDWHYILSGELRTEKPSVFIDVTIEFDEVTYIYAGLLTKWRIAASGKLDRIHLREVVRRKIDGDEIQLIGGDDFIAWCDEIKTLNIRYVKIRSARADGSSSAPRR